MTREELEAQHKRHDFIYLQKGSIEFALQQGLQQGMQAGEKKKAIEIAKNLLSRGEDREMIFTITGLTIEEIQGD
ncbi:MAG: hypothetical protein ABIJ30_03165 [bacterium]